MTEQNKNGAQRATSEKVKALMERIGLEPELLRMAGALMYYKPNEDYWNNVPVPKRPNGRVRLEGLRQLAAFVIPAICYGVAAHVFGWKAALLGLPVYAGVGYLLDLQLSDSIKAQRIKDEDLDRGRYAFTMILCEKMGLQPQDVTLELLHAMDRQFIALGQWMKKNNWSNHPENPTVIARKAREAAEEARRGGRGGSNGGNRAQGGNFGNRGGSSSGGQDFEFDRHHAGADHMQPAWEPESPYGPVNPASGQPMMGNAPIDVNGNGWGTSGGFGGGGFGGGFNGF